MTPNSRNSLSTLSSSEVCMPHPTFTHFTGPTNIKLYQCSNLTHTHTHSLFILKPFKLSALHRGSNKLSEERAFQSITREVPPRRLSRSEGCHGNWGNRIPSSPSQTFDIWSVACATGHKVYRSTSCPLLTRLRGNSAANITLHWWKTHICTRRTKKQLS